MSKSITLMSKAFSVEHYDEYFTLFLTLTFKNMNKFDPSLYLQENLERIASRYHLYGELDFNLEFKQAYLYVRDILRNAFAAFNLDYDIDHYKVMNDICANMHEYLECFKRKFYSWLVFLNDAYMNDMYIYDSIISKVIQLCESDSKLSEIKAFLSSAETCDELRDYDANIESLRRYTATLYIQRLICSKDEESISDCLNNRRGFIEFYEFINDKNNDKHFVHDSSFEELRNFINCLNNSCFKFIINDWKEYENINHDKIISEYEDTILSKHKLCICS